MKRNATLFLVILCSLVNLISRAEVITTDIAKETADNFLSLDKEWHYATEADVQLVEKDGVAAYYIVQYKAGGWVIVAAQSSSSPVIGYNTIGEFAAPAPVSDLLDFNAKIIVARAQELGCEEHIGWSRVKQRKAPTESIINSTPDIAPLITIDLNQGEPFNNYCPEHNGNKSLVGCVAVSMTQAMMVQGFPPKPTGSYSYKAKITGSHSINYDAEAPYNWEAIYSSEKNGDYDEVARMLYHVGVSINMEYSSQASSAMATQVAEALVRNFSYNDKIVQYLSKMSDDKEWLEIILNELSHGRVVVYDGQAKQGGGHCWNIDGWKQATQMVHCNWGWSGYGNGYFSLNNMTDSYQSVEFIHDHAIVIGIQAPTSIPYDILLKDTEFVEGTTAGSKLTYIEVLSTDNDATYSYELYGPNNTTSPYEINNNQLVTSETITDNDQFKYLRIKATNTATGKSYEKIFNINIVPSSIHNIIGIYNAHATSAFSGHPDEEWQVNIIPDRYDKTKVWLQPICTMNGFAPNEIYRVYATYNEEDSTLTMPLGQVLYEVAKTKIVCGISYNKDVETTGDITLKVNISEANTQITFAEDYIFGSGNILNNDGWWYQAIYNVCFTKQTDSATAPQGIELSTTTFALDTKANMVLADVNVLCNGASETFRFETYGPQGDASPYTIIDNKLVSTQTIDESDAFKYLRIKAINTLTQESCEEEFNISIVKTLPIIDLAGEYKAFAHSGFYGRPDEEWTANITVDPNIPNRLWIQPLGLIKDLDTQDINPVYVTYNGVESTVSMPLGQVLYEQGDTHNLILGVTYDKGNTIETIGNLIFKIEQDKGITTIALESSAIVGVGNSIGNDWWWQALKGITYTKEVPTSNEKIEVDGIYYNIINQEQKTVAVTYKGNSCNEYNDEYVGEVVIPETITYNGAIYTVTEVSDLAFAHCKNLTSITLGNNITSIGEFGFYYCTNLTSVVIPEGVSTIKNQAFRGSGIKSATIASHTTYGSSVFYECPNLCNVSIEDGVTTIPDWTFGYCEAITNINLPRTLKTIGEYSFYNCKGLTDITIPSSVTDMHDLSFGRCSNLASIVVEDGNKTFDSRDNCNAIIATATNTLLVGCRNTVIPQSVTGIGTEAFAQCVGLTTIAIPGSVTGIDDMAFGGCTGLTEIYVMRSNPPIIGGNTFCDVDKNIPLYVPTERVNVYQKAHYWNEFNNVIGNGIATDGIDIKDIVGKYQAFAHSAFKDSPDEEWDVYITTDPAIPDRLWIQPICLVGGLDAEYVTPVYATYNKVDGVLDLPLGQVLYEQKDKYLMILGSSLDGGNTHNTTGSLELYVTRKNDDVVISFNQNTLVGVGNDIGNQWWYQALYGVVLTQVEANYTNKINVNGIYYNIISESEKTAQVSYKGNSYDEYSNEYSGKVIIPKTITYYGSTYTVTSIEEYSFYSCTGITSVSIPATITQIGDNAFCNCTSITELEVKAVEPPVIYAETFMNVVKSIPVYVPEKSLEKYRTDDYWNEFTNFIGSSGIEGTVVDNMEIQVHNGAIIITGIADNVVVNLYSLQGLLMHSTTAGNIGNITLPRGMYILQVEGNSYKIVL
ncbi:MAG: leucine-rich repeat protein [Bacteroidaceae bacterium]|nr:leucine-rich repeat protein [Bacteroidaceae bacterium]